MPSILNCVIIGSRLDLGQGVTPCSLFGSPALFKVLVCVSPMVWRGVASSITQLLITTEKRSQVVIRQESLCASCRATLQCLHVTIMLRGKAEHPAASTSHGSLVEESYYHLAFTSLITPVFAGRGDVQQSVSNVLLLS
ncbi:hypothetical protein E2C01_064620 [Portunus trituberculatus]|uniref:Uncharacterized protein n=1 Tax=Portunus trituberculatus TaxID=210409 RepID=A0A5B7HPA1_PORTR|nr:hypothetical protein [Portunus trituberculatus]